MERELKPELLDEMPATDPAAIRSRADLRRLNRLMGHARLAAAVLSGLDPAPRSILEIGAGDGTFALSVVRKLPSTKEPQKVALLDQQNIVRDETRRAFAELGWESAQLKIDLFDWTRQGNRESFDVILANLFLHHFNAEQLRSVFQAVARCCATFVALEPRRSPTPLFFSHLLGVIGCNRITRHDAVVSVRAGFSGTELSKLWPISMWDLQERSAGLFSHLFVARQSHGDLWR